MKKTINIIKVIMGTCLLSIGFQPIFAQSQNHFTIDGTLENMNPMPAKIYLLYDKVTKKPNDSAIINGGKYTFNGSVETSLPITLTFSPSENSPIGKQQFTILPDEGEMLVTSNGSLDRSIVSGPGASAHNEFLKVTLFAKTEFEKIAKISQSREYATSDSLKKEVQRRNANVLGQALSNMISQVRNNPNSKTSPAIIYLLVSSNFVTKEMTDTLISEAPVGFMSTKVGEAIDSIVKSRETAAIKSYAKQKALEDKIVIGSKALAFTMNDTKGKPVALTDFRGKYVLLDFWASWCAPCRAENPNLVKAYGKYKGKGFNILGISLDGNTQKTAWLDAIVKDRLEWMQVSDLKGFSNEAAKLYNVVAIPQNFLIDPNGIVIAKNLRGEALEAKLSEIFK